jgi:hypothetical protein
MTKAPSPPNILEYSRIAYKSTLMWRLSVVYIEVYSLEEKNIEFNQFTQHSSSYSLSSHISYLLFKRNI